MRDMLKEIINQYPDEEFLTANGLDEAVIGVDESSMRIIYSVTKVLEILSRDMDESDSMEFFDFNIRGAYVGEKTPIWCDDYLQYRS